MARQGLRTRTCTVCHFVYAARSAREFSTKKFTFKQNVSMNLRNCKTLANEMVSIFRIIYILSTGDIGRQLAETMHYFFCVTNSVINGMTELNVDRTAYRKYDKFKNERTDRYYESSTTFATRVIFGARQTRAASVWVWMSVAHDIPMEFRWFPHWVQGNSIRTQLDYITEELREFAC